MTNAGELKSKKIKGKKNLKIKTKEHPLIYNIYILRGIQREREREEKKNNANEKELSLAKRCVSTKWGKSFSAQPATISLRAIPTHFTELAAAIARSSCFIVITSTLVWAKIPSTKDS